LSYAVVFISGIIKNIQNLDVPSSYKITDNRAKLILKILEHRVEKLLELTNVHF